MRAILCAFTAAAGLSGPAAAQVAEGAFPGLLVCDAAEGAPAVRERVVVEIANRQARYAFRFGGGTETGGGSLAGRRLSLSGRASGRLAYEARYVGEIDGRGGLLAGTQTGRAGARSFARKCQLLLGGGN